MRGCILLALHISVRVRAGCIAKCVYSVAHACMHIALCCRLGCAVEAAVLQTVLRVYHHRRWMLPRRRVRSTGACGAGARACAPWCRACGRAVCVSEARALHWALARVAWAMRACGGSLAPVVVRGAFDGHRSCSWAGIATWTWQNRGSVGRPCPQCVPERRCFP